MIGKNFTGASSAYAAYVDGDRQKDVVGTAYDDNVVAWWKKLSTPGHFQMFIIDDECPGARDAFPVDFDGDWDTDILAAAMETGHIFLYENDGNEVFKKHTITDDFNGVTQVYATDFDRDGDIDIIGAALYESMIAWWENTADWHFKKHTIDHFCKGAFSFDVSDIDSDSDLDIVATAYVAGIVIWYENKEMGFTKHVIASNLNAPSSVYAADMDRDWDIDILCTTYGDNEILLCTNDGKQDFKVVPIVTNFDGASDVCAAHLDNNRFIDILGAARLGNTICWWLNRGTTAYPDESVAGKTEPFTLHQSTPNLSDKSTMIRYTLHEDSKVTIAIFNNAGQQIRTLTNEPKIAGHHQLIWDCCDRYGRTLPNGVYLLRCTAGDYSTTQKLLILR